MTLKEFFELIRSDECISIYDVQENVYLFHEICKGDYHGEYDNCIVARLTTNTTQFYYPVLEVEVCKGD